MSPLARLLFLVFPHSGQPLCQALECLFCGVKREGLQIKRTTLWVLRVFSLRAKTQSCREKEWGQAAARALGLHRGSPYPSLQDTLSTCLTETGAEEG